MSSLPSRPADRWSPLYFLASVGAGGIAVTFFMWLYHWVAHPGQPVPVFEDVALAFANGGAATQAMIVTAAIGIAVFSALNLRYLAWNIGRLAEFRRSAAYAGFIASNAETQLAALPLALAMSINVGFILGLVFVPGLWGVVEYLFPVAMAAFLGVGALALGQIGRFVGRVLGKGGFDCAANNSFGQLLPAFALGMVGVGISAPAALSGSAVVSGLAFVLSSFFLVASGIMALIGVVLGMRAMLERGANPDTAPTLMIVVPLVTVLGILMLRQDHALHVHFGLSEGPGAALGLLARLFSVQVVFALLGLVVLARQGYAGRFLTGTETSAGSYALVCPGVGMAVMVHFLLNKGLVGAGLVAKFGVTYWALSGFAVALQIAMIALVIVLNRRHFGLARPPTPVAAG
jgi:hypothetical protein